MKFKKISPFCGQILESFPFIAEDFDQMTEYALYCKLKAKVDQIRIGVNDLGDDVNEYIIKFDNLKNYVDNYFDNLDVQDEINNKLNEMALDGTLEELLTLTIINLNNKSKTLCHRGYTFNNPYAQDNSSYAYVNAGVHGFRGIECDVRKDVNNVIVMLHNESVDSVSSQTGNINQLDYKNVFYKTKAGETTTTHLTTLTEAVEIAKTYNLFMLFDMGKNVVTCQEIVDICDASNFKDYGFFNVVDSDEFLTLPNYVLKVLGNDVFEHNEAELDNYLSTYGENNNLAVRVILSSTSDNQLNLIKSKGFYIIANYTSAHFIGTDNLSQINKIDFLLGDDIINLQHSNYENGVTFLQGSINIEDYCDSLKDRSYHIINALGGSYTPTNSNYICEVYNYSLPYKKIVAYDSVGTNGKKYIKVKYNNVWSDWIEPYKYKILYSDTDSTYNITLKITTNDYSVGINFYRENNHVTSSGWTKIGQVPAGYEPKDLQLAYFCDGAGNALRFRVQTNGEIDIYAIPNTQIAGNLSYII